jgi:putative methyltransferase
LLLVHDLLLAKRGIALPGKHGLHVAVSRHKARLTAELTKARIRRKLASLDALRAHVNAGSATAIGGDPDSTPLRHPRWIRINTLRSTLEHELATTFASFERVSTLNEVVTAGATQSVIYIDEHVSNLVAVVGVEEPTKFKAYKEGKLIFQEKASCFPAALLNPTVIDVHVIDACAAPGNKTTHLAAILQGALPSLHTSGTSERRITACEKDTLRSETLVKMVKLAEADGIVTVKKKQDFLRLDPFSNEFANVTALLLDPSCSGSGIVGRDEGTLNICLPSLENGTAQANDSRGKKRKRGAAKEKSEPVAPATEKKDESKGEEDDPSGALVEETAIEETDEAKLKARLESLSTFQLRLLTHAMAFPAARKITYSTCSIHNEENENVVFKALSSEVAREQGWQILKRSDQVEGMRKWHKRGSVEAAKRVAADIPDSTTSVLDCEEIAEACIRCDKRGEDGTMGFFVAGFVRDESSIGASSVTSKPVTSKPATSKKAAKKKTKVVESNKEEEWNGFGDDD